MSEAAFRQMIAASIRQTRPQSFRLGKPPQYPQRVLSTATAPPENVVDQQQPVWRAHPAPLPSHDSHAVGKPRLTQLREDTRSRPFSSFLTDTYAREHNYLRISVTERCNLRCVYCMPEEGVPLSPSAHNLTTPEIVYLSTLFVLQGVDKIRLTGGEPTVRKDIVDLMHQIGHLRKNGLKELCLTTNGISLHRKLDAMVDAGLTGVNLSLDTLDPFQFTLMTRRNGHEAVMKSIQRILEMNKLGAGIKLKINCVVMRGINEREILPFVEMGKDEDLEVRFIEYMPFDGNKWSRKKMLSFQEMLAMIEEKYPNVQKMQGHANDTSKTYKVPGFMGRIGFITSMTHNFCGTCNRLRITSDGNLKVCLFGNSEVSLRDILRQSNDGQPIDAEAMEAIKQLEQDRLKSRASSDGTFLPSDDETRLLEVIGMAVKRKKAKHAGMGELENMKNRPMILIDPSPPTFASLPRPPVDLCPQRSLTGFNDMPFQFSGVPLHVLPTRPVQQPRSHLGIEARRWISTKEYIRKVRGQSVYRRVKLDGPIPAPRTLAGSRNESAAQPSYLEPDTLGKVYASVNAEYLTPSGQSVSSNRNNGVSKDKKKSLTHLTSKGEAHMVDISTKKASSRLAVAQAVLYFSNEETYNILQNSMLEKGDALAVARIAAIQAAKRTPDLIPLAHPSLGLTGIDIDLRVFRPSRLSDVTQPAESSADEIKPPKATPKNVGGVLCIASVSCEGKTGVEMEALTSATVAALTLYDMLKGVDKAMNISSARVIAKRGGKSGDWHYNSSKNEIIQNSSFPVSSSTGSQLDTVMENGKQRTKTSDELAPDDVGQQPIGPSPAHTQSSVHDQTSFVSPQADFQQQENVQYHPSATSKSSAARAASTSSKRPQVEGNHQDISEDGDYSQLTHHHDFRQSSHPTESRNPNLIINEAIDPNQIRETFETTQPERSDGEIVDTDTPKSIKFDRTTRDKMSGTWCDRFDSRDFQSKRIERYEDWARQR